MGFPTWQSAPQKIVTVAVPVNSNVAKVQVISPVVVSTTVVTGASRAVGSFANSTVPVHARKTGTRPQGFEAHRGAQSEVRPSSAIGRGGLRPEAGATLASLAGLTTV